MVVFPNVIVTNINTSIDSVLLPTMSNAQVDIYGRYYGSKMLRWVAAGAA